MKAKLKAMNSRMNHEERSKCSGRQNNGNYPIKTADRKPNEKKKSNIRSLWDKIKWASLCIMGISDGNEREKGIKNVFEEVMTENFPNLKKETHLQVQEAQRIPNLHQDMLLLKWQKCKDSKGNKRKNRVNYKGPHPIWLSTDFSTETLQARMEWQDIFEALQWKNPAT